MALLLCERLQNHGLQDYRHVITSTFFTFFNVFLQKKKQKVVTFYVFCRVSYVFSNYAVSFSTG